jgi:hypothetical protein
MTNQNDPAISAEIEAAPLVLANDGLGFIHAFDKIVRYGIDAIIETDGPFHALVLTHEPEVYRGFVTGVFDVDRVPHIEIRREGRDHPDLVRVYDVLTLAVL